MSPPSSPAAPGTATASTRARRAPCWGASSTAPASSTGARLARVTFEILGPVPIGRLEASAGVVRPGRSVELVEGTLAAGGRDVIRARAWRVRTVDELPLDPATPEPPAPPGPEDAHERPFFPVSWDTGYHTAMDVRFASGGFTEPGPAVAWMRMRRAAGGGRGALAARPGAGGG